MKNETVQKRMGEKKSKSLQKIVLSVFVVAVTFMAGFYTGKLPYFQKLFYDQ